MLLKHNTLYSEDNNSAVAERPVAVLPESPIDLSIKIYDRSCALMRGLDLVLRHHECPSELRADCVQQLHDHLDTSPAEDVWVRRVKYVLAYPLAKYLKQSELPKEGDIPFTWRNSGFSCWFRKRLRVHNRTNTHLFYSWFQAKRACLPCSQNHIKETYDEHNIRLTANDDGDVKIISSIFEDTTFQYVLKKIKDQITNTYKEESIFQMAPSTSACFTNMRSENGQYGFIRNFLKYDYITDAFDTELISMGFIPCGYNGSTKNWNCVFESRSYNSHGKIIDTRKILSSTASIIVNNPNLSCQIQAVIEPLKVRVISKGDALPYYLMHPLQKAMHSSMRSMNCFRLIGQPFSTTMLYDLAYKAENYFKWFSVDYSAATDGLSWQYTKQILGYLISGLPADERRIAMAVLGPHKLFYPNGSERVFRGIQRNGQLMGSILSFPILCLANLGVYLLNSQFFQEGWSNDQRLNHVLVNGDDMLYAAPENYWETHKNISSKVGLKMSPGKAYIHSSYININSVSCEYDLRTIHDKLPYNSLFGSCNSLYGKGKTSPWRIDFLNVGLFYGNHKVMAGSDDKYTFIQEKGIMVGGCVGDKLENELIPNLNAVLEGSRPGRQAKLLSYYISFHNKQLIYDTTFCINGKNFVKNLFLPIEYGGYGINCPNGFRFNKTTLQKRVAYSLIFQSDGRKSPREIPSPGYDLLKSDGLAPCPFRITGNESCDRSDYVLMMSRLFNKVVFVNDLTKEKRIYKRCINGFQCYARSRFTGVSKCFTSPSLAKLLLDQMTYRDLSDLL